MSWLIFRSPLVHLIESRAIPYCRPRVHVHAHSLRLNQAKSARAQLTLRRATADQTLTKSCAAIVRAPEIAPVRNRGSYEIRRCHRSRPIVNAHSLDSNAHD